MKNKLVSTACVLFLLIIAIGMFSSFNFFKQAYRPYYSAYNYHAYNAYQQQGHYAYPAYAGSRLPPYIMPSLPDNHGRISYNSHIYPEDSLTYTYYKNPQLFQPRRMSNHHRYVQGLWPWLMPDVY